MTHLYAQLMWEMAEHEKAEAIFFLEAQSTEKRSDVAIKRLWRATEAGQRLIELKNYEKATSKVLSSLKSRIYAIY